MPQKLLYGALVMQEYQPFNCQDLGVNYSPLAAIHFFPWKLVSKIWCLIKITTST